MLASIFVASIWFAGCLALAGCAALRAPVAFEPTAPDAHDSTERPLRLDAQEGRPNGLVLRFWCTSDATNCEMNEDVWLEVLRREDGARAERIRSVRLDERLRERLTGEGIELLDRSIGADSTTTYQVRLRASDGDAPADLLMASELLNVDWIDPPERPEKVRISSKIAGLVELRWTAPRGTGALIFRRDVLDTNARPERLAHLGPAARGVYVDRSAEPGGVYAYRVALAVDTGSTVQFGQPSEEIYVTVRASPQRPRQSHRRR